MMHESSVFRPTDGFIVGVVDHLDVVYSKFGMFSETTEIAHARDLPNAFCKWRWDFDRNIYYLLADKPTPTQFDFIRRHLTRKYNIRFWENGHFDIDDFISKM